MGRIELARLLPHEKIFSRAPRFLDRTDSRPWPGWAVCVALLAGVYAIAVRACDFDHAAVLRDLGYMAAYVWLPGMVVLGATRKTPVGWVEAIALALPVGYAVEIASFLGFAALG